MVGDTIGPLTIFFFDLAVMHVFLIYFEKNSGASKLLIFLVYAAHICAGFLMIALILTLFIFEDKLVKDWHEM